MSPLDLGPRVSSPRVENRQDVWMRQAGGCLDLLQEPLGAQHGREFRLQDLKRHLSLVPEIFGEIDRRYAAFAEVTLDPVAVREGGGEAGGDLGHGLR